MSFDGEEEKLLHQIITDAPEGKEFFKSSYPAES